MQEQSTAGTLVLTGTRHPHRRNSVRSTIQALLLAGIVVAGWLASRPNIDEQQLAIRAIRAAGGEVMYTRETGAGQPISPSERIFAVKIPGSDVNDALIEQLQCFEDLEWIILFDCTDEQYSTIRKAFPDLRMWPPFPPSQARPQ